MPIPIPILFSEIASAACGALFLFFKVLPLSLLGDELLLDGPASKKPPGAGGRGAGTVSPPAGKCKGPRACAGLSLD